MRRVIIFFLVLAALTLTALPAAAQVGPRVTPVNVDVNDIDDAVTAQQFNPDTQFIVADAQDASAEGGEPSHACAQSPGTGTDTVWFMTRLYPGTVTLDTTGSGFLTGAGPSSDTVVTLYQMTGLFFSDFNDLTAVACNENGAEAGIINAFNVTQADDYYIQVSSSPSITPMGASTIILTATANPINAPSLDDPENAKTLKFLSLPSVLHVNQATRSLDEPDDPSLAEYISTEQPFMLNYVTNTIWFKFTLTQPQVVGIQNIYGSPSTLWFSLFESDGVNYELADGVSLPASPNVVTAVLDPGTYYLRIGVLNEPLGASAPFSTYTATAYFVPHNFDFGVAGTEGLPGATPDLTGWTLKKTTPGPTGDGIFCDTVVPFACYLQFASSGGDEATSATAKITLDNTKVKKGDFLVMQAVPGDTIGTPNLVVTLTLTGTNGAKQKHTLTITDTINISLLTPVTEKITVTKAKLKIKNKDTVSGNRVEISAVIAAGLRTGEGVLRGPQPLLNGLSVSWTGAESGALPVPPPAQ